MKGYLAVVVALVGLFGVAEQQTGALPLRGPEAWLELMGGNVRKDGLRLDLRCNQCCWCVGQVSFLCHPYPGFLQGGLLRQIASVIFDAKIGLFESIHATTKAEPCTSES